MMTRRMRSSKKRMLMSRCSSSPIETKKTKKRKISKKLLVKVMKVTTMKTLLRASRNREALSLIRCRKDWGTSRKNRSKCNQIVQQKSLSQVLSKSKRLQMKRCRFLSPVHSISNRNRIARNRSYRSRFERKAVKVATVTNKAITGRITLLKKASSIEAAILLPPAAPVTIRN